MTSLFAGSVYMFDQTANHLIILLVLVAAVIGASTLFSAREVSLKSGFTQGLGALLWASPVIAVFSFVAMRVLPSFQFGTSPQQAANGAASWLEPQAGTKIEDVDSFPEEFQTVSLEEDEALPEWTTRPIQRLASTRGNEQIEVYRVVRVSEWANDVDVARAELAGRIAGLVQKNFSRFHPGGSSLPVDAIQDKVVRAEAIEKQYHDTLPQPFTMYRVYWQVELSPEVRAQFADSWKAEIGAKRAWLLGGVFALLTLFAGTFAAYFHLDKRSNGSHRFRLKVAATAMMTAGALGMLAAVSHHV